MTRVEDSIRLPHKARDPIAEGLDVERIVPFLPGSSPSPQAQSHEGISVPEAVVGDDGHSSESERYLGA